MKAGSLPQEHNSARVRAKVNTSALPNTYIDGSLLRSFEESAQRKGLLGPVGPESFYPLWFHYENERNVHLWKQGLSLGDVADCRIWIDPLELIEKVLNKDRDTGNPLTSPGYFSGAPAHTDESEAGRYFQALAALLEKALPHLHALSHVGAELLETKRTLQEVVIR